MNPYTFNAKRTPRGRYYVIVTIGKDVIYVSRKTHSDGERAVTEAQEYLENQSGNHEQKTSG